MQTSKGLFAYVIQQLRRLIGQPNGLTISFTLFMAGLIMTFLDPSVDVLSWPEMP